VTRSRSFLTLLILFVGSVAQAQDRAPIYASSSGISDFLSRAVREIRLEPGDSVMLRALTLKGQAPTTRLAPNSRQAIHHDKCGTGLLGHAHEIASQYRDTRLPGSAAVGTSNPLAMPPGFNHAIRSPRGLFTIHYYRGSMADAATDDFAVNVARFCDEAYALEVEQLGYAKPPFTGADSTYHIYIGDLGPRGVYGYVERTDGGELGLTPSGVLRTRSFMVIDNDFMEVIFTTKGLLGARVTIFHEFHHMIQFGSYGNDNSDNYFQEMTATWMETLAEPDANDYLQYVDDYLRNLSLRFDKPVEAGRYGQVLWIEFLAYRYRRDFIRQVWEHYRDVTGDPLPSFDAKLREKGSSFACAYAQFGEELFFIGSRSRPGTPFEDAGLLPKDSLLTVEWLEPGEAASELAFGASLHLFASSFGRDTVVLSIARDTARLVNATITNATIVSPTQYIAEYSDAARFCESFGGPYQTLAEAFPQPYIFDPESRGIAILASGARRPATGRLSVHSASMTEVRTIEVTSEKFDQLGDNHYLFWDGRDAFGKPVPSGIYLYSIEADGEQRAGKVVVIRKQ
jgi:hypothetical protein